MVNNLTRGGLVRAKIETTSDRNRIEVEFMFNPHEYTLSKRNTFNATPRAGANEPQTTFRQGGPQTLRLTLHFDTLAEGTDVRIITDKLWKMMMVDEDNSNPETDQAAPPEVAFAWGRFYFKSVLTSMTQKFTLFKPDGTPVRCQADITLEQREDTLDDYRGAPTTPQQAIEQGREAAAILGDRIDNIVAPNSSDLLSDIRKVLEENGIDDPLNIAPGVTLRINI